MQSQYPLAAARTLLDVHGRELVMKVQENVQLPKALSLVIVRSGQRILSTGAQSFVDRVDYGEPVAVARRVRAATGGNVWLDPLRAWGRPAVRAVPAEALAEGFRAGSRRVSSRSCTTWIFGQSRTPCGSRWSQHTPASPDRCPSSTSTSACPPPRSG